MDPLILMLIVVLGMVLLMNFFGKKQRQRIMEQRETAIVVGNQVRTQSGFYGTIVDIDGDTVTLESPSGDETVWHKHAIAMEQAPPYAVPETTTDEFVEQDPALAEGYEPEFGERLDPDTPRPDEDKPKQS
ncbi:preprotein translocase subunit YajC [Bowdeniella nasicola]|nr:preprotein translocase subunit YajC [Bowdeniella nasicola]